MKLRLWRCGGNRCGVIFALAMNEDPRERECPVCHVVDEWQYVEYDIGEDAFFAGKL